MNNYVTPNADLGAGAIQDAVARAKATGVDKVVIPEGEWRVEEPILIPSFIHIFLDGATVISDGVAFRNENLYTTFGCMKEGRQSNIVISGMNSAKIKGGVVIHNADKVRIDGLSFEGDGVTLSFCHDVRVNGITADGTALHLMNGCHQMIVKDVSGETGLLAISRRAAVGDFMSWNYDYNFDVFEHCPDVCFGVFQGISGRVVLSASGEVFGIEGEADITADNKDGFNIYNFVIER